MTYTTNHDVNVLPAVFERYRSGAITFWPETEPSDAQRGDTLTMRLVNERGIRVAGVVPLRFEITDVQMMTFRVPIASTDVTTAAFAGHFASLRRLPDGAADA